MPRKRLAGVGLLTLLAIGIAGGFALTHRHQLIHALQLIPMRVIVLAVVFQLVVIVARCEAWRLSLAAAGAPLSRRALYPAAAVGTAAAIINAQVGALARIVALRRVAPKQVPPIGTMIAAELPIFLCEAIIGIVLFLFAAPAVGIAWWIPVCALIAVGGLAVALAEVRTHIHARFATGFAVLGDWHSAKRLVGVLLVVVAAQTARLWVLLYAAGLVVGPAGAIAVLVSNGLLQNLPLGPVAASGASLLVFAKKQAANAAAVGLTVTVTDASAALFFALIGAIQLWLLVRASRDEATPVPRLAG